LLRTDNSRQPMVCNSILLPFPITKVGDHDFLSLINRTLRNMDYDCQKVFCLNPYISLWEIILLCESMQYLIFCAFLDWSDLVIWIFVILFLCDPLICLHTLITHSCRENASRNIFGLLMEGKMVQWLTGLLNSIDMCSII